MYFVWCLLTGHVATLTILKRFTRRQVHWWAPGDGEGTRKPPPYAIRDSAVNVANFMGKAQQPGPVGEHLVVLQWG